MKSSSSTGAEDVEIWTPIYGYEREYEISNFGNINSLQAPNGVRKVKRRKKVFVSGTGNKYWGTILSLNNKSYNHTVHHLVLSSFCGPRPEGMECRHLDGDSRNCRLDNLKWGTHQENMLDKRRHGTVPKTRKHKKPMKSSKVLEIRRLHTTGLSYAEIGRMMNVSSSNVALTIKRKIWKNI